MAERSRRQRLADISRSLTAMESKLDGHLGTLQDLSSDSAEIWGICIYVHAAIEALEYVREQVMLLSRAEV